MHQLLVNSKDWRSWLWPRAEPVIPGEAAAPGAATLATSRRGVFAVGDVRSSSVKRVAAAVGDGAQVVALVHAFLAEPRAERVRAEPVLAAT